MMTAMINPSDFRKLSTSLQGSVTPPHEMLQTLLGTHQRQLRALQIKRLSPEVWKEFTRGLKRIQIVPQNLFTKVKPGEQDEGVGEEPEETEVEVTTSEFEESSREEAKQPTEENSDNQIESEDQGPEALESETEEPELIAETQEAENIEEITGEDEEVGFHEKEEVPVEPETAYQEEEEENLLLEETDQEEEQDFEMKRKSEGDPESQIIETLLANFRELEIIDVPHQIKPDLDWLRDELSKYIVIGARFQPTKQFSKPEKEAGKQTPFPEVPSDAEERDSRTREQLQDNSQLTRLGDLLNQLIKVIQKPRKKPLGIELSIEQEVLDQFITHPEKIHQELLQHYLEYGYRKKGLHRLSFSVERRIQTGLALIFSIHGKERNTLCMATIWCELQASTQAADSTEKKRASGSLFA
ncbi:MAG: hypothetical protein Q8O95_04005 [bacterium]|nr:hypothetical protein [bacterium]